MQLVMAAMTTAPSWSEMSWPSSTPETTGGASGSSASWNSAPCSPIVTLAPPSPIQREYALSASSLRAAGTVGLINPGRFTMKLRFSSVSGTRSCGRFGPARLGTMLERSSSSVVLNTGSGVASVRKSSCSLQ